MQGKVYPLELKYKTRQLSHFINGESYNLKSHGAGDFGCYDFVKDICQLERFSDSLIGYKQGYAIWLTNDQYYWNPPRKGDTGAAEFRVYHGSVKSGTLTWRSSVANTGSREKPLSLRKDYKILWSEYSVVSQENGGTFKYALISV
ncbi:MAG: hypothetical protein FWE32_03405 [Oscillospiraceae bacterium]|nr:hypothetical protein [Oscillospiraceae bacterium]